MQCCQPKQKTGIKLHRQVFQRIKESKWRIYCESNIFETDDIKGIQLLWYK